MFTQILRELRSKILLKFKDVISRVCRSALELITIKLCIKANFVSQKKWKIILDIFFKILVYIELTFKGPFIFDGILPDSMPVNESANKATIRMYILSRNISQGTKYLAKYKLLEWIKNANWITADEDKAYNTQICKYLLTCYI